MVLVEGIKMKGKQIPEKRIIRAWKNLSSKSLPKIKAIRLSDEDFDDAIKNRQCYEDDLREVEEWGKVLSTWNTDACVYNANKAEDAEYVILIRKNPYHSLDEIIVHELTHIARGDL